MCFVQDVINGLIHKWFKNQHRAATVCSACATALLWCETGNTSSFAACLEEATVNVGVHQEQAGEGTGYSAVSLPAYLGMPLHTKIALISIQFSQTLQAEHVYHSKIVIIRGLATTDNILWNQCLLKAGQL